MSLLMDWAKEKTELVTFIKLRPGADLGLRRYSVPEEGLYVPLLTEELAERIQQVGEDQVLTVPSILRGILFLLGADPEFKYKEKYLTLARHIPEETKAIAVETARQYEKEGVYDQAAMIMRGFSQINPMDDQAAIMLAVFYVRIAGNQANHSESLEKSMMLEALHILESKYPDHQEDVLLLFYLGTVYQWQKSYLKAEKTWKSATGLSLNKKEQTLFRQKLKEIHPLARYEEGYQLILRGNPAEGLEHLQPIIDQVPEWWNLHFFVAMGKQQMGQLDDALRHYGKVLEIRGFHKQTAVELSEIYLSKGDYQKASHWMEEVILQHPGDPEMLCRMSLLKAYGGSFTEAFEFLALAQEAGGESEMLTTVGNQVKSLSGHDE